MIKTRKRIKLLFWKLTWIKTGMRKVLFAPSFSTEKKTRKIKTIMEKIKIKIRLTPMLKRTTLKLKISKNLWAMKRTIRTSTNSKKSRWSSGSNSNRKRPLERSSDMPTFKIFQISSHLISSYSILSFFFLIPFIMQISFIILIPLVILIPILITFFTLVWFFEVEIC